jgi:hypothetical protein
MWQVFILVVEVEPWALSMLSMHSVTEQHSQFWSTVPLTFSEEAPLLPSMVGKCVGLCNLISQVQNFITLGKLLNPHRPQYLHLSHDDNNTNKNVSILWGLSWSIHRKPFEECLAPSKYSVNVISHTLWHHFSHPSLQVHGKFLSPFFLFQDLGG